ncbi:MAG: hypothetical protein AAGD22_00845 [Verrucomicrobiota bacterium]
MKSLTFLTSALLILTGLVGYFGYELIGATKKSFTSLIPSFIGILMLVGALIANKKHALGMHISVTFALLGALAGLGRLFSGGPPDFSAASTKLISVMTVICVIYTILAVRSFIAARRARS